MGNAPATDTTIDGTVDRVAFHNPDSTYTVAKVTTKEGEVTIVGKLMGVDEGMPLRLRGTWEVDKKWGRQFKVNEYELITPKTAAGIERFLGSKVIQRHRPVAGQADRREVRHRDARRDRARRRRG